MRIRTRLMTILATALLALAATTGVVLAAPQLPFAASGALIQIPGGTSSVVPWGSAKAALAGTVPAEIISGVDAAITGAGGDDSTPGALTTGQTFAGALTASTWDDLAGAAVGVNHNSWFTAPTHLLSPTNPIVPAVGVAYGGFTANGDDDDTISGQYAAFISGIVYLDLACVAVSGSPLAVNIVDVGGWAVVPGSASGEFKSIHSSGGGLSVTAVGCIGAETATLAIDGTLVGDHDDRGKGRGDDDDDDDRGKGRGDDDNDDRDRGHGNDDDDDDGEDEDRGHGNDEDDDDDDNRGRGWGRGGRD